jgi:hypothetical protein
VPFLKTEQPAQTPYKQRALYCFSKKHLQNNQSPINGYLITYPRISLASPTGSRANLQAKPAGQEGASGRFDFCFGCSLAGVLFGSQSGDVGTHSLQGYTIDTADEVRPVLKQRFFVERRKVISKAVSRSSGAGCLEVVDEHRNIKRRVGDNEQVDMIGLNHQLAAPDGEAIGKRFLEVIQQFRRQRFAARFRYQNDMLKNSV